MREHGMYDQSPTCTACHHVVGTRAFTHCTCPCHTLGRQPTAEEAKEAAIQRHDAPAANTGKAWMAAAAKAVGAVARRQEYLTTDDLWATLPAPPEPRAMGAAMRKAARAGLVTKTDRTRPSKRAECHAREVRVWRSKVCRA